MYRTFTLIKALHSHQCAICNTHIFYNRNYYARELPIIMRVKGGIMQQATRPLLTHPVGNVTNMCFAMTLIAHTHSACFNYGESDILFVKVSAALCLLVRAIVISQKAFGVLKCARRATKAQ